MSFILSAIELLQIGQHILLQIAMDNSCDGEKLRQPFYYKMPHGLLQIATGISKVECLFHNYQFNWLL